MINRTFLPVFNPDFCFLLLGTSNSKPSLNMLKKMPITCSASEALNVVKSGDRVFIHSVAMAPQYLIENLVAKAPHLQNVEIIHLHTEGIAPYVEPQYEGIFHLNSIFVGSNVRKATQEGRADYIPVFLSESPLLIKKGIVHINVALVQVSTPDKHGYVSLGSSVDATLAAILHADVVIAQVNKFVPRAHGDAFVPLHRFDYLVHHDAPMLEHHLSAPNEVESKIGQLIAGLVEDGATLQMGIGAIPNAVLQNLTNHRDLGVHTEMFSDGLLPLVASGVVNNSKKKLFPNKIVASFVMGGQETYDFLDDNPMVQMKCVDWVNDVSIIRQNDKVTAINSAIEIDLTGQVCADSIGYKHYSGVGGQIDFIRGASFSEGGKPIIALPSITNKGVSKISGMLKNGAGVVSTRANVHYVVTENGIADLYGKPMQERARELIRIAHPSAQEELDEAAFQRFGKRVWAFSSADK